MNDLHLALADYLNLRRSLGYKLRRQEKLLNQFIKSFLDTGAPTITTQHALTWACQPKNACNNWWSCRLSAVRGELKSEVVYGGVEGGVEGGGGFS